MNKSVDSETRLHFLPICFLNYSMEIMIGPFHKTVLRIKLLIPCKPFRMVLST